MNKNEQVSFEEIFKQNERRVYYHIHQLRIQDPLQEFYREGLIAMWKTYGTYHPDEGPFATYFNFIIRNRLIKFLRKKQNDL
ncbi:RNA polymerase sigma factor (sigma-70 family) [Virgibacillus natechei]|uniref:RNA polymerase sigma factor (Sigma-70 family) n=1 Tax=Virgibacillus natechei TaxID=1216297 RepID=A0ABS4IKG2_9BACI|nr:sigma factor [Virgibacillus natechei]MBP1971348.1 RNA polymerase sigma factor (sigma-70 family) [Virgibacillus natechei]UZD12917.1 hypothetical protein OLD84_18875 [Virgibacillus natechei]